MSERNIVKVINRYGSDGSIALAARISYGAKHVESERVGPIINGLIANKEGTPFEFASMWFYIRCSRLCHSQFLQYRHASRITRSTRRVDPIESENADLDKLSAGYEQTHIDYALRDYAFQTDELKIPREIARRILPMSILTEFYWLVNLRELMHFLDERLSSRAEQEIRDIAKRMELEFAGAFPITYKAWRGQDHLAGRKYSSNDYVSFLKRYMELRNLGEQEFRNIFTAYQMIELELYNTRRNIETISRMTSRLRLCKVEAIQGDVAKISELEAIVTRISELEAMIGKRKADLIAIAESNARYHSQK